MDTSRTITTDLTDRPIEGQGLDGAATLGALLDQQHGPTILVFLRHYG